MKVQDALQSQELRDWVVRVYGESVLSRVWERLENLPEDYDIDPVEFASDAFCEDHAETFELVDRMKRSGYRSYLELQ